MKRLLVILLSLALVAGLCACGGGAPAASDPPAPESVQPSEVPASAEPAPAETPAPAAPADNANAVTQEVIFNMLGTDVPITVIADPGLTAWTVSYSFNGNDVVCSGSFEADGSMNMTQTNNDFAAMTVPEIPALLDANAWTPCAVDAVPSAGGGANNAVTQEVVFNMLGTDVPITVYADPDLSTWAVTYSFNGNDVVCSGSFEADGSMNMTQTNNDFAAMTVPEIPALLDANAWTPCSTELIGDASGEVTALAQVVLYDMMGTKVPVTVTVDPEFSGWTVTYSFNGNDVECSGVFEADRSMTLVETNNDFANMVIPELPALLTETDWHPAAN